MSGIILVQAVMARAASCAQKPAFIPKAGRVPGRINVRRMIMPSHRGSAGWPRRDIWRLLYAPRAAL